MLSFTEYQPSALLSPYIECYWELKGILPTDTIVKECLVPGGRAELIFAGSDVCWYGKEKDASPLRYSTPVLLGQRDTVHYIGLSGPVHFMGARFKHGCQTLFGYGPAFTYTNKLIPLRGPSIPGNIGEIDGWLLQNFSSPAKDWQILQACIDRIRSEDPEEQSIKEWAAQHGWNYKKTERVFLRYTGYTPRTFIRVIRFKRVLEQSAPGPTHLTSIAHRYGYYDQSHFIREFHHYTGIKPSSFYRHPPQLAAFLYRLSPHVPV